MVHVRDDYPRFQQAGGEVAVVTMGSPAQVGSFRQQLKLPFVCLSDESQIAYRAYGVPRGTLAQIAGPQTWHTGLRALWRGGLGIPHGDVYQLHSAFVVDPRGIIRFAHRPESSADIADHETILASLRAGAMF